MTKAELTLQRTAITLSNGEAAPTYLQPYAGFLESNPRIRTAAEAIEMYSQDHALTEKERERVLQGYIWQEDPKNIKHIARLTDKLPSRVQATLIESLYTFQDHFHAIDNLVQMLDKQSSQHQERKTRFKNLKKDIKSKVERTLEGRIKEVALLSLEGKNVAEISSATGLAIQTVKYYLHRARRGIEKEDIYGEGLVRLRVYDINTAQVRKGNIDAVEIFNIHYILSEDGEAYREKKGRRVDQNLLKEGFFLARDKLNLQQYQALRIRHKDLYFKHKGRICISADNLRLFLTRYHGKDNKFD